MKVPKAKSQYNTIPHNFILLHELRTHTKTQLEISKDQRFKSNI